MVGLRRKILAVALEEDRLAYVNLTGCWGRWRSVSPGGGLPAADVLEGGGLQALERLLRRYPVQRNWQLHVGLPRRFFFVRDVQLPAMPLEDAYAVVQNGLSLHCHLPLETVYTDVRIRKCSDGTWEALVVYAPREVLAPVLSVVEEAGHGDRLEGFFPLSFGWAAWMQKAGVAMPAGMVWQGEEEDDVVAVGRDGRVRCLLLDKDENPARRQDVETCVFQGVEVARGNLFLVKEKHQAPEGMGNARPWGLPAPWENPASLAAAVALEGKLDVCLDGRPPRIRMFHPAKAVVPLVVALTAAAFFLSWHVSSRMDQVRRQLGAVGERVRPIQSRRALLEKNLEEIQRVQTLIAGAAQFIQQRPRFYSFLNDLAERVPSGTWISNFRYGPGGLVVQCVSPDSLKAIEGLRKSPFVESVELRGSVTRRRDGAETFSVSVRLK